MRVAIDISPLKTGHRFRGVGRYTENLIQALKKEDKKNEYLLVKESAGVVKAKADLVHYPYFDLFQLTLPFKKEKPTVVTVHDLTPLVFPKQFPKGVKGWLKYQIQRQSLKGVQIIMTDSQNSKKDIIKFIGFPKKKIKVVYLAPAENFKKVSFFEQERVRKKYQLPEKFISYVGDVNYNKNLPGLVKAFSQIGDKDLKLVFVGKAFENKSLPQIKELIQLIESLGLINQTKTLGFIPDKDLPVFYNLASLFCYPSFYEGFGLPILEAFACGCPVVAGQAASLPELAGQAALLVNPYDINKITQAIEKVSSSQKLRKKLIDNGFEQVKKFSWAKTAQEVIKVYEQII